MKILFMSPKGGNGLSVGIALANEGHEVSYWNTPPNDRGKGYPIKVLSLIHI